MWFLSFICLFWLEESRRQWLCLPASLLHMAVWPSWFSLPCWNKSVLQSRDYGCAPAHYRCSLSRYRCVYAHYPCVTPHYRCAPARYRCVSPCYRCAPQMCASTLQVCASTLQMCTTDVYTGFLLFLLGCGESELRPSNLHKYSADTPTSPAHKNTLVKAARWFYYLYVAGVLPSIMWGTQGHLQ